MNNIALILCLFTLFTSCFTGRAQTNPYSFQKINIDKGLSFAVLCMTVSHEKGYVWMGTRSGIGRFNGYESKKYLQGEVITNLVEDQKNTIWATTRKGVFYYDDHTDTFHQIYDDKEKPLMAHSICLWNDGVIFGGHGKLYKYSYENHHKQPILLCNFAASFARNITSAKLWDEQTILCANRWNNAILVDIPSGKTRPTPFPCKEATSILTDTLGNIWVANYNDGVKCYDKKGKLLQSYHTKNSSLKTNIVLSLAEKNGKIWMATDGQGIYILDPETQKITSLAHIPGNPYSLPGNSFLSLYKDSQNFLWAGSVRNGLIRIKEVGMKIYGDAIPGSTYAMSEKSVLSLYQDPNENIYIGTDGGGMNILNPNTQKFTQITSTYGDKIASITHVDNEQLLISLFSKGLFFFHKQNHTYKPLIIVNDSINHALCGRGKTVNVYKNTPETILLLCETPYIYHIKTHTFTPIKNKLSKEEIVGPLLPLNSQTSNTTYLYDQKHIYLLNPETKLLETLYQTKSDTLITSISLDANQQLWIGSNYGLSYYNLPQHTIQHINNKLIKNISSLICDQHGRVWIAADGQLFSYLIHDKEFILYDESDGIYPNEYLNKPKLITPEGDIYLGGVEGLLRIDHQRPQRTTVLPKLQLSEVQVGGERVNHIDTENPLLKIGEKSKPITVKLMATNKDIFRKPIYRYTLKGMDGQIIYSYLPEQTFNGLPAGKYQVLAACTTRMGGWTKDYLILDLNVLLPWYKTPWFYFICILLILGIAITAIFSMFRKRENQLKLAMKEKERQIYEEKVRFLININHELRTPLTLIHAPLKQLLKSISATDHHHPIVERICKQTDRMKNLLNMVLDVRKMEVESSSLQLNVTNIHQWIEDLIMDFLPEAHDKNIEIKYEPDYQIQELCMDKEKCTIALSNLLINALKYSTENKNILLSTHLSEDTKNVRIEVSDQGPGLKNVDTDILFTRFYQGKNSRPGTGIGLSYSKILMEQQGGKIGAYDHGELPGSTFWIELPTQAQPGQIVVPPQAYLNELLASTQEVESFPNDMKEETDQQPSTILIVDDNQDLTDYLQSVMLQRYQKVWIASNGKEALDLCMNKKPDIVISDIQMPVMNGYELCKNIKENLEISHIPVILLTARIDEDSKVYGYKNGADDYLSKPFETDTLYSVIDSLLKNRQRIKKNYTDILPLPQPEDTTFSTADEEFLKKLNQIIHDNINNPELGVNLLCSELAMSRATLYNKLKALTNMGSNEYVTKIRLEQAIHLLKHTQLKVNEIADQTGFSTSRYFSTAFKQYIGCTPTQYKDKLKKEEKAEEKNTI